MKKYIISEHCYDSADYVEIITGSLPAKNPTLNELENMQLDKWNYPLTEIGYIIENEIQVVLVRFPGLYGGYEYRFCEVEDI